MKSAASAHDSPVLGNNHNFETPTYQTGGVPKGKKDKTHAKYAKGKNSRPLNSFMAFRCYYSVLFDELEQKIISTYVVFLWEHDLCKAKWALAAKAYSVIRDHVGKEHAPLDLFLMIVAELLGLIEPQRYLAVMGWEISVNEHSSVSLVKTDKTEIADHVLHTNISAEDIVAYACQHGYAGAMGSIAMMPNDKPIMAMAASAQLLPRKHGEHNKGQDDQNAPDQTATLQGPNSNATTASDSPHGVFSDLASTTNMDFDFLSTAPIFSPGFEQFATMNTASSNLVQNIMTSNSQVTAAGNPMPFPNIRNTSSDTFMIDQIRDFDPQISQDIFEPTEGDKWDAFDISSWIHQDAYTN
ncbi:MAG: hypothetical protein Q9196_006912 [Gyalolechia fulgens]